MLEGLSELEKSKIQEKLKSMFNKNLENGNRDRSKDIEMRLLLLNSLSLIESLLNNETLSIDSKIKILAYVTEVSEIIKKE